MFRTLEDVKRQWHAQSAGTLAVLEQLTDEAPLETDEMYGETWPKGFTVLAFLQHEIHHRGQMTALMRRAGLRVPGLLGPAREDWATFGMPAPEL